MGKNGIYMFGLEKLYKSQKRLLNSLIIIYLACYFLLSYKTIFLGLILGTLCGYFNLWLMVTRTSKYIKSVVQNDRKAMSLGTFSRMALAAGATMLAVYYPEFFSLYAVILGLMTIYIVIMINLFFIIYKENTKKER